MPATPPPRQSAPPLALPDITLPLAGTGTLRQVLNASRRGLVRDFTAIPPRLLTVGNRALYQRVLALVQGQLRADPRPVVQLLRQPTHAALLGTLRPLCHPTGDLGELNRLTRELLLLVLVELAVQGLLPAEGVVVPRDGAWPALRSLAANLLVEPALEVEALAFTSGRLVLRAQGRDTALSLQAPLAAPGAPLRLSRPYLPIVDGVCLALADNNPLSHFEAHPDKRGNRLDLGGRPADEWVRVLREAFAVVDRFLPLVGEEMRLVLRLVVPVGWDEHRHLSASYREAVGTVYLTLHPQLMTMVEALVHEFQHNKLNAVLSLDPLLVNAFSPRYRSPVRPDPRPLHGVLLAVHAFQPVAALYEAMAAANHPLAADPRFLKRFRDIIRMDRAGARTVLDHGQPTPLGEGLLREMRRLDEGLERLEAARWSEPAPGVAPDLPVDG